MCPYLICKCSYPIYVSLPLSCTLHQKSGGVEHALGALILMWCATVGAMQSTVSGVSTFSALMV